MSWRMPGKLFQAVGWHLQRRDLVCRVPGVEKKRTRRCSRAKAKAMCKPQESVDMNEVAPSLHGAERGIMDCSVAAHCVEEECIWTEGGNSAGEPENESI